MLARKCLSPSCELTALTRAIAGSIDWGRNFLPAARVGARRCRRHVLFGQGKHCVKLDCSPFETGCFRSYRCIVRQLCAPLRSGGSRVELRVLGPLEVRHDGSPVALRGAKPRQLLVLLAMRANRPVSSEQLIEELWEGEPPPSAATALRVHVAKLRRALEPDRGASIPSGRLPAGPHGYLLRVEPDELDAQRFERLVVLGRDSNAAGDLRSAVPLLTQALDLWHGPALVDVRDLSAARGEISRLEELHVEATEELADARLGCGEHAFVVDVLGASVERYPLRERLTAQLMLALYRCGRGAEALRAFAHLAGQLDEQLGVPPSAELRRL